MFNDKGLGEAMAQSAQRDAQLSDDSKIKLLEARCDLLEQQVKSLQESITIINGVLKADGEHMKGMDVRIQQLQERISP